MKIILPVMLMALALPAAAQSHPTSDTDQAVPAYVTNAISDPARKADKADDSRRQMAAMMTFTGVKPGVPVQVDLVYTSQNYHDYHNRMDIIAFNKKVYEALKPGGLYVIIDHVAPAGSGASDTDTLHRIDPALVRKEVEAAGFVFGGANDALRNRDDPHTVSVLDDSIRGHTDQFIYRFRKPAQ